MYPFGVQCQTRFQLTATVSLKLGHNIADSLSYASGAVEGCVNAPTALRLGDLRNEPLPMGRNGSETCSLLSVGLLNLAAGFSAYDSAEAIMGLA